MQRNGCVLIFNRLLFVFSVFFELWWFVSVSDFGEILRDLFTAGLAMMTLFFQKVGDRLEIGVCVCSVT